MNHLHLAGGMEMILPYKVNKCQDAMVRYNI